MRLRNHRRAAIFISLLSFLLVLDTQAQSQSAVPAEPEDHAGFVPALSGGIGYIQNVNGGINSLEPQINPVLLIPFGSRVLLESRGTFFGFYQRNPPPDGPYKGQVFKSVAFAQLDWLATPRVIASAGRYVLPFGLYNERLSPIWVKNLQDAPLTGAIGLGTSGSGNGFMLRGTASQSSSYSIFYTAYFSALSTIDKLGSARVAGGDASVHFTRPRLELGVSYQRFLQDRHTNSAATYLAWQPREVPLDIKAEGDYSYNGRGYWIESAYLFKQLPIPSVFRRTQAVARMQQFFPLNGGGNGLPTVNTERFDFGLNYYFRDDLRFISSYGRRFSSQGNTNVWNFGFTYRFMIPLWPARTK